MRNKLLFGTLAVLAIGSLAYAVPAVAHHAFGAEFDPDAPLRLEGEIERVEWVNPHSWIHIRATEIETADGVRQPEGGEVWAVEGGTPNVLLRRGLQRECLMPGTVLIVDGYQAKDHSLNRANGRNVTFTDGQTFFMGSSGTGAPEDGAEREALEQGRQRC